MVWSVYYYFLQPNPVATWRLEWRLGAQKSRSWDQLGRLLQYFQERKMVTLTRVEALLLLPETLKKLIFELRFYKWKFDGTMDYAHKQRRDMHCVCLSFFADPLAKNLQCPRSTKFWWAYNRWAFIETWSQVQGWVG